MYRLLVITLTIAALCATSAIAQQIPEQLGFRRVNGQLIDDQGDVVTSIGGQPTSSSAQTRFAFSVPSYARPTRFNGFSVPAYVNQQRYTNVQPTRTYRWQPLTRLNLPVFAAPARYQTCGPNGCF